MLLFSASIFAQPAEPAEPQMIVFANNAATALLPEHVTVLTHENTILAKFGIAEDHTLELSFNPVPAHGGASGIDIVRSAANKKGMRIKIGKDRAVLMELAGDQEKEGKIRRTVHWQIGVPTGIFVLTITAPMPMSPVLSEFLEDDLNKIIYSLSSSTL